MSVDLRLSFLLIQRFQNWVRNVRENPKVLSTSPSQTAAAHSELWTEFHKTLRCNSVSQSKPPTADISNSYQGTPPQFHSFFRDETGGRAKFSPADFPRRETHVLNGVQCGYRQSSWEVGCSPHRYRFHWSCSGSHLYGVTNPGQNRFYRKSHSAAQLCFPLRPFPHT